ncbi:hypothetical protein ACMGDH_11250 [Sphingomonas sp. DT-207]|uniref:hypothetical protein n=1 Tax=Sphingomonas sp. DT-207 TaxID=3396167 RepID=UPI003F1B6F51
MNNASVDIIRSQLSGTSLHVVVECPEQIATNAVNAVLAVTITDFLGKPVPVTKVGRPPGGGVALTIEAALPDIDPEADPPSYLLSIGQHAIWFALPSPGSLASGAAGDQPPPGAVSIDYLARDYTALTEMMRSRVSQIVEDDSAWALDHPADPITTILEVLAYAGDHLSFRQDAAGTESYLTTARHRLSLRRHGRLRDYAVNDGCNARTALVFAVSGDGTLPAGVQVVTLQPGEPDVILAADPALAASTTVFETMHEQPVSRQRNDLGTALARTTAYTIPAGSITLTLQTVNTGLMPGQLVVLQQLTAPAGVAAPFGAQVLRLLKVEEVGTQNGVPTTVLSWHPEDALAGPLTVPPVDVDGAVSLYGNVVLADHGRTLPAALQPATVPATAAYAPSVQVNDVVSTAPPPRIAAAFDGTQDLAIASLMVDSAKASLNPDPRNAAPCISLRGARPGMAGVTDVWSAQQDLLSASSSERAFAASIEDGSGSGPRQLNLRFGDGTLGCAPAPDTVFTATARSGGGQSGRVRANSLLQIIGPAPLITWVTNPLPASPFTAEDMEAIRLFATTGFRTNLRGIEPDDWTRIASADPLVTEVHARLGRNGQAPCSVGLTTRMTIPDDVAFEVARARLMDHAVLGALPTVTKSTDVELEIALVAYCAPGTNIAAARARLAQRIGTGMLPDGSPAFFNPLNWPLGRQVRLDELTRAIRAEPAVTFVACDPRSDPRIVFETILGDDDTAANIAQGRITIEAHQRARIGNDSFRPALGGVRLYLAAGS